MLLAQSPAPAADLLVLAFVAGFAVATLVFWAATTHAPPHQPTGRIEHRRAPIHGVPRLPGVPGLRRVPRIHCGNATESSVQRRTIARGNAFGIGRKPPPRRRNRTGRGAHRRARVGLRRYRGRPLEAVSGKSRGGFRQGPGTDRTAARRIGPAVTFAESRQSRPPRPKSPDDRVGHCSYGLGAAQQARTRRVTVIATFGGGSTGAPNRPRPPPPPGAQE